MQTFYIIPEVKRYWSQMKSEIWDILYEESLVLAGDGYNDSPGHSAKYCMYALMETELDIIVDVEIIDKRESGGVSTNMEALGLKRILERMVGKIIISEIVTDAVVALVRKMKDIYLFKANYLHMCRRVMELQLETHYSKHFEYWKIAEEY